MMPRDILLTPTRRSVNTMGTSTTRAPARLARYVVSIWNAQTDHRFPETAATLRALGAQRVAPALALFWKYPEIFLPYYCLDLPERVLEAADEIRSLYAMLADEWRRPAIGSGCLR